MVAGVGRERAFGRSSCEDGAVISSVLSDGTIRRLVEEQRIRIEPWDPAMVQPASVDLKLGTSFRVFHNHRLPAIDLAQPPTGVTEHVQIEDSASFVIHPGEFVLGSTVEWVELPNDIVTRIEGKSSLGRLALIVHATPGFVDPGVSGTLTPEITNLTRVLRGKGAPRGPPTWGPTPRAGLGPRGPSTGEGGGGGRTGTRKQREFL